MYTRISLRTTELDDNDNWENKLGLWLVNKLCMNDTFENCSNIYFVHSNFLAYLTSALPYHHNFLISEVWINES